MSLTAYNRLGVAVSTAMEASSQTTSDHMDDRMAVISNGWEASADKIESESKALNSARKAGYSAFDGQRTSDHQAMLEDMLENVIGEVTAEVAKLVTEDGNLDKQFQDDNAARLAAWAEIAERIGSDEDIDIK
jgi:hypothetical protein